ncbi:MAG: hypothetical protein OXG15_06150 [Gammaproteobacteria bacterium]|nr:hypothetical protein [Gammaproteobacteria bacterium]
MQKAEEGGDLIERDAPPRRLAASSGSLIEKVDTAADSDIGIVLEEWQNARLLTLLDSVVRNRQESSSPCPEATLPSEPCTWASVGSVKVCWVGPNRWLTLERVEQEEDSWDFSLSLSADTHVVDTTGNFSVFSITGPSVKRLLQKSCAFDFHESVFSSNSCVSTTFAKTQALVVAGQNDGIELVARRSYSDYVCRWIADASREFGFRNVTYSS